MASEKRLPNQEEAAAGALSPANAAGLASDADLLATAGRYGSVRRRPPGR